MRRWHLAVALGPLNQLKVNSLQITAARHPVQVHIHLHAQHLAQAELRVGVQQRFLHLRKLWATELHGALHPVVG